MNKYFDFYYRSSATVHKFIDGLDSMNSVRGKCAINYFVLKSNKFKGVVDREESVAADNVEHLLSEEKLSVSSLLKLYLKVSVNWAFFFLFVVISIFNRKKSFTNLVKTYVEVEYDLFAEEIQDKDTLVLVFPFPLSLKRQLKYIKQLFKTPSSVKFALFGTPYSFLDLLKLTFNRNQFNAFKLEYNGTLNVKKIIQKIDFQTFLNMDDIDACGITVTSSIIADEREVVTKLHGIGTYAPFIESHTLECFNLKQAEYYKKFSPNIRIKIYPYLNNDVKPLVQLEKNMCILFFSQITSFTKYLIDDELSVLSLLSKLSENVGFRLLYKPHPNAGFINNDIVKLKGLKLYDDDCLIGEEEVVSLSFFSTSFYTFEARYRALIDLDGVHVPELFSEEKYILTINKLRELV